MILCYQRNAEGILTEALHAAFSVQKRLCSGDSGIAVYEIIHRRGFDQRESFFTSLIRGLDGFTLLLFEADLIKVLS